MFMSLEVFTCTYETFLMAKISDIDICMNRYVQSKDVFLNSLKELQNGTGIKKDYTKLYPNTIEGASLMFNHRHKAKPSVPFLKLYDKETELLTKSAEFYNNYLQSTSVSIKNLTRVEVTIRNYAHRKRLAKYGVMPMVSTLNELLDVTPKELFNVLVFSIKGYINPVKRVLRHDLSPAEHVIFELLQNSIQAGYSHKQLLAIADTFKGSNTNTTAVAQTRIRKQITKIYDLLIHKDLKIKSKATHNAHIVEYLSFMGLDWK